MCNVRAINLHYAISRNATSKIFYPNPKTLRSVFPSQKRTLTKHSQPPNGRNVIPPPQSGGSLLRKGISPLHVRASRGWKDRNIDFELNMEQSVKRGVPIPQVSLFALDILGLVSIEYSLLQWKRIDYSSFRHYATY